MGYRWRLDGVNDYAQFANSISIDLGQNAYTVELKCIINAWPTTFGGIIGRNGTPAGFFIMPNGALSAYSSGAQRYSTAAGYFILGELHTYRLEHDAAGAWRAYRDGVLFGSGSFATSATAAPITRIGQATNGDNSFCSMDLEYIEVAGVTNGQKWNANLSNGTGVTLQTDSGANAATLVSTATDGSQWVFFASATAQSITIPAAKQQDLAATVAVAASQIVAIAAAKQQDCAAAVAVGTTQVLTIPATKQQDVAATTAISTTQVLAVAGAKQQDKGAVVTIGTNQLLTVPAAQQLAIAPAVSVAQVAPGSQPVTVPAAKQQDVAGVVTVGTSQLINAAGAKQQDKASTVSVGQSQIVSVAAIKQQDKAQPITVGTIQTLAVQPVTQTDTAARVAVGTTQLVAVPSAQQIDRAATITTTQQPPITQTIDVRTLRIELTTQRLGVARNTPVYTAQLTTPRFNVARA